MLEAVLLKNGAKFITGEHVAFIDLLIYADFYALFHILPANSIAFSKLWYLNSWYNRIRETIRELKPLNMEFKRALMDRATEVSKAGGIPVEILDSTEHVTNSFATTATYA